MAVLSGFTRSPKPTPCNSFTSGHSSRCKLQKIRSRRSLVQLVQITCVSLQAYRHSSRSTSILSYRAAALACPACLLACPALACALAAGLASAALAYKYGLRWQSCFTALCACPAGGGFGLAGLPALRPSVLPAGLSCCLPCCCLAGGLSCPAGGLFWPLAAGLLSYVRRPCFCPCWLALIAYKDRPFLGLLAGFLLPSARLAPWLALAGFVLPIKMGGGLAGLLRLAYQRAGFRLHL